MLALPTSQNGCLWSARRRCVLRSCQALVFRFEQFDERHSYPPENNHRTCTGVPLKGIWSSRNPCAGSMFAFGRVALFGSHLVLLRLSFADKLVEPLCVLVIFRYFQGIEVAARGMRRVAPQKVGGTQPPYLRTTPEHAELVWETTHLNPAPFWKQPKSPGPAT